MTTGKYTLNGRKPQLENDLMTWAEWFETADRHVAQDNIHGIRVSTVFLGLDHNFSETGPPILFETMIFGVSWESGPYCKRYATWDEAEKGHKKAIGMVMSGIPREKGTP